MIQIFSIIGLLVSIGFVSAPAEARLPARTKLKVITTTESYGSSPRVFNVVFLYEARYNPPATLACSQFASSSKNAKLVVEAEYFNGDYQSDLIIATQDPIPSKDCLTLVENFQRNVMRGRQAEIRLSEPKAVSPYEPLIEQYTKIEIVYK